MWGGGLQEDQETPFSNNNNNNNDNDNDNDDNNNNKILKCEGNHQETLFRLYDINHPSTVLLQICLCVLLAVGCFLGVHDRRILSVVLERLPTKGRLRNTPCVASDPETAPQICTIPYPNTTSGTAIYAAPLTPSQPAQCKHTLYIWQSHEVSRAGKRKHRLIPTAVMVWSHTVGRPVKAGPPTAEEATGRTTLLVTGRP